MVTLSPRRRLRDALPGLVTAAIVLVPYPTAALSFRTALVAQAVTLLALVAGLLALGLSRPGGGARLFSAPPPLLLGLGLYAAAAGLGALVALLRSNDPGYLAGQLLSMGLLPLAAAAGLLAGGQLPQGFATGLVGGVTAAAAIHFAHWLLSLARGDLVTRLYLPNAIAAVGPALMAIVLAVALAATSPPGRRRFGGVAAAVCAVYIVGSGVRSLWLVTPLALAVYLLLAPRRPRNRGRQPGHRAGWLAVTALTVLAGVAILGVSRWWERPRPNLLAAGASPPTAPGLPPTAAILHDDGGPSPPAIRWHPDRHRRSLILVHGVAVEAGRGYRARLRIRSAGDGFCYLVFDWLDGEREVVARSRSLPIYPGKERHAHAVGFAPDGSKTLRIRVACTTNVGGEWLLQDPELHALDATQLALVVQQLRFFWQRLGTLPDLWSGEQPRDISFALRLNESLGLLDALGSSSAPELLFGHGLGATFYPRPTVYVTSTRPPVHEPVNYIHNYYLFLVFKLGILGTLLVLAALALFTVTPWRARRRARDPEARRFLAAVAAIWLGYAVWSVACPQILDFRMAPLWGLLIAATAGYLRPVDEP